MKLRASPEWLALEKLALQKNHENVKTLAPQIITGESAGLQALRERWQPYFGKHPPKDRFVMQFVQLVIVFHLRHSFRMLIVSGFQIVQRVLLSSHHCAGLREGERRKLAMIVELYLLQPKSFQQPLPATRRETFFGRVGNGEG